MSSNNETPRRDYRGRGKRAAQHYQPRNKKTRGEDHFQPLDADLIPINVGSSVVPLAVQSEGDENDPFAPQTSEEQFAGTLEGDEGAFDEFGPIESVEHEKVPAVVPLIPDAGIPTPMVAPTAQDEALTPVDDVAEDAGDAAEAVPDEAARVVPAEDAPAAGEYVPQHEAHPVEPELVAASVDAADAVPQDGQKAVADSAGGGSQEGANAPAPVVALVDPFAPSDEAQVQGDAAQVSAYSRGTAHYAHRKASKGSAFSGRQRLALVIVAVVAMVVCGVGGAAFAMWQNAQSNIELKDDSIKEALTAPEVPQDPYWTLILGSDSRSTDTQGTRSDVIMLARVDALNKKVTLVSIPRDSKVVLEGYGMQKINAAYALGGAKLAISTIEDYAGVDISHYVEVYFKGFSNLVDELGGVTVKVPEYVSYKDVTLQPGKQKLNGKQALTFARNRKTYQTGDFRRTECQRILVSALARKVLNQDVTQIPNTITSLSKCFSTDMPLGDVVNLALAMQGLDKSSFYSAMAPSTTGMVDGVSYTFTYTNQWKLLMQRAKQGKNPKLDATETEICGTESTQTVDLDMSVGLPKEMAAEIKSYEREKAQKAAKKKDKEQQKAAQEASTLDEGGTSSEQSGDLGSNDSGNDASGGAGSSVSDRTYME